MAYTKIGMHSMGGNDKGEGYTRTSGCTLVKLVNGFADAERIVNLPHRPLVIGRVSREDAEPEDFVLLQNPRDVARWYVINFIDPQIAANPAIIYWEGINEPVAGTIERMLWIDAYNHEFTLLMAARGKKAVVCNFSVGNPERWLWAYMTLTARCIKEHGAILGLHRYLQLKRTASGAVDVIETATSFWGRYHLLDADDWQKAHGFVPPTAFTEAGIERIGGTGTWKEEGVSESEYGNILNAWDNVLMPSEFVLGAGVFTSGVGGALAWLPHDIGNTKVLDYMNEHAQTKQAPTTRPPTTPAGTHRVIAVKGANVRQWPWVGPQAPPKLTALAKGVWVTVYGEYKGWAQVGQNGNEWISAGLLERA